MSIKRLEIVYKGTFNVDKLLLLGYTREDKFKLWYKASNGITFCIKKWVNGLLKLQIRVNHDTVNKKGHKEILSNIDDMIEESIEEYKNFGI